MIGTWTYVFCQKSWSRVHTESEMVSRFQETVKEERSGCQSCLSSGWGNESHYTEFLLSRTSQELQAPRTICFVISKNEASQALRGRCVSVVRWGDGWGGGGSGGGFLFGSGAHAQVNSPKPFQTEVKVTSPPAGGRSLGNLTGSGWSLGCVPWKGPRKLAGSRAKVQWGGC